MMIAYKLFLKVEKTNLIDTIGYFLSRESAEEEKKTVESTLKGDATLHIEEIEIR